MTPQYAIDKAGVSYDTEIKPRYWVEEELSWAEAYAEPGYSSEKPGIFFANWNPRTYDNPTKADQTMPRLAAILEKMGAEIEWSDEWLQCDCGKAFRTSGDSYSWLMYGYIGDGDYACGDCVLEDPEDYLEERINNPKAANVLVDLSKHGWTQRDRWHPGQNDDPQAIAETIPDHLDYIFEITGTGQWDISFAIYTRLKEDN